MALRPTAHHMSTSTTTLPLSTSTSPILLLIAGAPCAGKNTVLTALKKLLLAHPNPITIATLHQRDFLRPSASAEILLAEGVPPSETGTPQTVVVPPASRDLECAEAFDLDKLADAVDALSIGVGMEESFVTVERNFGGSVGGNTVPDIVVVEGSYLLTAPRLVEAAGVKVGMGIGLVFSAHSD